MEKPILDLCRGRQSLGKQQELGRGDNGRRNGNARQEGRAGFFCAMSPQPPKYSLSPLEPSHPKNHLQIRLQNTDCSGNGSPAQNYPQKRDETPEPIAVIPHLSYIPQGM